MSQTQNKIDPAEIEAVQRHVRQHKLIAVGLVAGTILTIWASQIKFASPSINIAIALTIAAIQGFLIVGFFMHLVSEKKMIYSVLVITVFLFVVQMGVTVWARSPENAVQVR